MSTTDEPRTKALFADALDVPPDERAAFLDEHCDDDERRADVAALLGAHDRAGRFFGNLRANVSAPAVGEGSGSDPTGNGKDPWGTAPDPLELEGTPVAGYAVQEHIGKGGMGLVYRAWDPRLERSVALKFLPPFLAMTPSAQERFVREARTAARLEHPNVATIHEIGETERGRRFIAMTHYDGHTLRERMARDGPFDPATAAEYARTVAEALHQVHRVGIVHRDVKPANLMMTDQGTLKLLDFGLAKAAATGLSVSGRRLGTPSYMSPEQATGTEAGPATDLWALGVMLYEMLTGERPFSGQRPHDTLDAVREDDPVPVRTRRSEVPRALASIVSTCLTKDPEQRYASAEALASDLRSLEIGSDVEEPHSIAVLPFSHRGSEEAGALTEGMHESILAQLANVSDLKVIVGTASDRDDDPALSAVAEELGVRWIVKGSVQQAGDQVRITARLFDAQAGATAWAEVYRPDLTAENLFDVQERITREITSALTAKVTPGERERIADTPTQNLTAYRLYVEGRVNLDRRHKEGVRNAVEYFQEAVQEDPTYALAWAGLADAVNLFPLYAADDHTPPEIDGENAARRALELAPDLAEAHASLAYLQDLPEGIPRLRHALDLKPSYAQAHTWLGMKLLAAGELEDARDHAVIASELEPRNMAIQSFLACHTIAGGQYQEGVARVKKLVNEVKDESAEWGLQAVSRFLFAALYSLGQWEEALGLAHRRRETTGKHKWATEWRAKMGLVEAATGKRERARERVEQLQGEPGTLHRGYLFMALGDEEAAVEAFTEGEVWGYFNMMEFRFCYPELMAPLRRSDRYESLLETVDRRRAPNPTAAYHS